VLGAPAQIPRAAAGYHGAVRWVLVALVMVGCRRPRTPLPPPPEQVILIAARDRDDIDAIRAHGWDVWQRLQDRWQSWPHSDVVLGARDRIFRELQAFRIGDRIERETAPLMFAVSFDPIAAAHVAHHRLASRRASRGRSAIPDFPDDAILLKAVWYPVHREGVTRLPVWDGESARPEGNPTRTWTREVVIDPVSEEPTSGATLDDVVDGVDGSLSATARTSVVHHVPLDAFIYRTLVTVDEVVAARRAARDPTLAIGDHVVLVGMHISTREIPDWVWITAWWHDRPDAGPYAAGRPASLGGAARSYLLDVAISATSPREADGSPHVAMNPYLEARFQDGVHSNCVACHRRAALGATEYLPVTRGDIAPTDPYFADKTTTDMVWSLALEAR